MQRRCKSKRHMETSDQCRFIADIKLQLARNVPDSPWSSPSSLHAAPVAMRSFITVRQTPHPDAFYDQDRGASEPKKMSESNGKTNSPSVDKPSLHDLEGVNDAGIEHVDKLVLRRVVTPTSALQCQYSSLA